MRRPAKLSTVIKRKEVEKEFIRAIGENQGILHKICFVYADSKLDREDLYQDIIFQLWKSYSSFRGKSKFSTWMYQVALNTAITKVRRRRALPSGIDFSEEFYDPTSAMDYSEDLQILYQAISHLSKVEKALILMWLDEKSYQEMSATLGMSEKNVSVSLVRIKRKLTDLIKKLQ